MRHTLDLTVTQLDNGITIYGKPANVPFAAAKLYVPELDKIVDPQRQKEAFASIRPSLCVGRDSNPRRHKSPDLQSGAIDHSATYALSK
jgi:hypothetical protein